MGSSRDRIRFLRDLRSVRRYAEALVPAEVVADLLEVARWTGSSANRQPWELVVVRDPATRRALAEAGATPGHVPLADAPLVIAVVLDSPSSAFDGGRLCERLLLAASAHGLGASLVGFKAEAESKAKAVLGVPPDRALPRVVVAGYPAAPTARLVSAERSADPRLPLNRLPLGRKPTAELVHEERYTSR
ncbi:nitroreductase family protein [Actinophytocola gossypii]|uniref:Nitroreductase family protein n=1 Tax=Actinophytocola gossypii TaxID=2812003 RepID=A0ABT2J6B1_9PSEU|nr:nitroreductase family protein [Actinophytocola gossypii]MCT2582804.1 nitroreductase family protein [Actinophytocola gossypii]